MLGYMDREARVREPDVLLMERVASEWVQAHRSYIRGLDGKRMSQRLVGEAWRLVHASSAALLSAESCGLAALAGVAPSSWDSSILGVQVTKLAPLLCSMPNDRGELVELGHLLGGLLRAVELRARDLTADIMIARSDARDIHLVQALEESGFRTMDSIATLYREIDCEGEDDSCISQVCMRIRPSTRDDVEVIRLIAGSAFRQGHFHNDSRIATNHAQKVYAEWAANSCNGRSDVVLVAEQWEQPGKPCGFITCRLDRELVGVTGRPHGVIDLVSVAPEAQRRGVGRALVEAAVSWFSSAGAQGVEVGTQLANPAAIRTYQSVGFRCVAFAYTLHKWIVAG